MGIFRFLGQPRNSSSSSCTLRLFFPMTCVAFRVSTREHPPRNFTVSPGTACENSNHSLVLGDGKNPTFNDGNPYFMGIYKPLRHWVDGFIPYYMEIMGVDRPDRTCVPWNECPNARPPVFLGNLELRGGTEMEQNKPL